MFYMPAPHRSAFMLLGGVSCINSVVNLNVIQLCITPAFDKFSRVKLIKKCRLLQAISSEARKSRPALHHILLPHTADRDSSAVFDIR